MRYSILFSLIIASLNVFGQSDTIQKSDTTEKKKKRFLVLPIAVATPEIGFGLGALGGVYFKTHDHESVRTSNIQLLGLYSTNSQLLVQSGGNIYFPREYFIGRYNATYVDFPNKFWGIGNNTPNSNKESYTFRQLYIAPQFMWRAYKRLFLGLSYEYQNLIDNSFTPGGLFDQQNVVGRNGGVASGLGPLIAWDSRNNAFWPNKGEYFQFYVERFNSFLGSDFKFNSYYLDLRKYIPLKTNVLAFQFVGEVTTGTVPFRMLPALGGPYLLRGYYYGRFTDKDLIALQGEYRFNLYKRFGAVAFAGAGRVSNELKNFDIKGLKPAGGVGLRYAIIPKEKLNIRLDFAVGKNSTGLYFFIMEAF